MHALARAASALDHRLPATRTHQWSDFCVEDVNNKNRLEMLNPASFYWIAALLLLFIAILNSVLSTLVLAQTSRLPKWTGGLSVNDTG